MIDYHYGVNVLSLLNELSAHDTDDIHGGDFEVEGESPSGASGFATVDIPMLAQDAAKMIVALQQNMDAMAAENAALKSAILTYAKVKQDFDEFDGDRRGIAESLCEAEDALVNGIETPATDVYLNSVRAEAVNHAGKMIMATMNHQEKGVERALICIAEVEMLYQLRSGTHDTADKEASL